MARPPRYCMKMLTARNPADLASGRRTDVCGLEHGHEGDHEGKYRRMRWTKEGRVLDWGFTTVPGSESEGDD